MTSRDNESKVARRVRSYRQRMREQGMRPIQMWVADVRAPSFADEARKQSAAVAASHYAAEDQAFIDALGLDDS